MTAQLPIDPFIPGTRIERCVLVEQLDGASRAIAWRAHLGDAGRVLIFIRGPAQEAIAGARYPTHPGLVPVLEVSRSAHVEQPGEQPSRLDGWTVIVTDEVAGPTLEQWLADNPASPAPDRLALVRMIASALDSLHAAGLPHGNVTAGAVRVPGPGVAVLTLPCPDADTSREADVLDFLRLVFACLTGSEPLTDAHGILDYGGLRRQLLAAPALRRRPSLAQQLAEALVMPSEARPVQLRRWVDRASAASAAETVTGPTASPVEPSIRQVMPKRRRLPRGAGALALAATVVIGIVVAVDHSTHTGATPRYKSPAAAASALTAATAWPMQPGCDSTTALALPNALGPRTAFPADPRSAILKAGGAAWHQGTLTIALRNPTNRAALVLGVDPHRVSAVVDPPAWVYRPSPSSPRCTQQARPTRSYVFDMDRWSIRSSDATSTNTQGPYLPIAPGGQVLLQLIATTCRGNARFDIDVRIAFAGISSGQDLVLPSDRAASYTVDGVGDHTAVYSGTSASALSQMDAADPSCSGAQR